MKKVLFLTFFLLFFLINSSQAAENISDFSVDLEINQDSSLNVSEKIDYDFGVEQRHGIYRDIPYKYKARGGNYITEINDINVTDENGRLLNFSISKQGDFVRIKIGDPDVLITGLNTYIINYKVAGAINYFDDHDELYWNVTGNEWPVMIDSARADVSLPENINKPDLQFECFAGIEGSKQECEARSVSDRGVINFFENNLMSNQGLTIVVGWPKGIVYQPSAVENIIKKFGDNSILFLPILVLGWMVWWWNKNGRDPAGSGTIIARYSPPDNLTPAEVGTVIDEKVNQRDISAIIIDLAVRGYIKITKIEKKQFFGTSTDYKLDLLKPIDDSLKKFERILLKEIFKDDIAKYISNKTERASIELSDLKNEFYKTIGEIEKNIYSLVTTHKYFSKNPNTVRTKYTFAGILVIVAGFFIGIFFNPLGIFSFFISGLIIIIFSFFMPVRTTAGVKVREYILGLKRYLEVAEKDRLKFHNAPEKSPELFEKLLPFAMVLKVENQWAEQFRDIYRQPPSWYNDPSGHAFNAVLLTNSLHSFSATASTTLNAQSSSVAAGGSGFSSGGFSGGGFGGGGGGSW